MLIRIKCSLHEYCVPVLFIAIKERDICRRQATKLRSCVAP